MRDRITLTTRLHAKRPAAPLTRLRPMLNDTIRVGDHLPMAALMTRLPTPLLP